jgi:3-deoxy-D-manno-octulosonate 8-phosphate phosphatase (KDO 8-P phosphatase)
MDVDGVLTDGTVLISSDGTEAKAFSILDGRASSGSTGRHRRGLDQRPGLRRHRAPRAGAENPASHPGPHRQARRAAGTRRQLGLAAAQCAYMGDDDIDAPAIAWAGIGAAPSEAMPAALAAAGFVARRPAGRGAVRDVCEQILAARVHAAPA